ncbi:DMT family transporter [Arthrobacter sp. LAPM80]|uniref:DMT family transporter n=1 Tax=Arthrobacter sp. LAPM80 TaxID=3141788 RepID=UPI00398BB75A
MRLDWLRRPDVLMVVTSAPTYVATGEVLKAVDPLDLTPLRFLMAAAILGVYFLATRGKLLIRKRDVWRVVGISALGYGAYGTLLNLGQTTVPAGTVSLLLNTSPVFAFILGYVVLGERTSRRGIIGMAVATVGVATITVFGPGDLGFDWNAITILAAALVLAAFLIWQQPVLGRVPPVEMVFWGCIVGGLVTLPMAKFDINPQLWGVRTIIAMAVLVVGSTVLAYSFWNLTLAGTSVAEGGSLLFAVPLFSMALGWLILGQIPTLASILGGCIALVGVMLLGRAQNIPHQPDKEDEVLTTSPVVEEVVSVAITPEQQASLDALVDQAIAEVGARLATISLWRPVTGDLIRIYTSLPEIYRVGGISAELGIDWTEQCVARMESFIAESPDDLQSDAFEHHDTLAALRLGAGINAVVQHQGRFLGCLNLMDAPGSYTHEDLARAQIFAEWLAPVMNAISSHMGTVNT